MPYRKRRAPRRRPRRNFRRLRRRKRVKTYGTGISGRGGVHLVRQKVYSTFTIPPTATNPGAHFVKQNFTLADLPQALSFRQLYDEYKINAVNVKIILNSATTAATNQNLQIGYVLNDKDDAATPLDWNAFLERAACKIKNLYPTGPRACEANMYLKPTPLTQLYESLGTTGYALMKKSPFVDMGDPTVPHYGLLYGFNNGAEQRNLPVSVTVCTTYYMSFRGLK
ncbi:MAG: capsid protein [Cressdnaviricota sp.]|nr:MAG: capsid protein [Cressdnaviricota sp.]